MSEAKIHASATAVVTVKVSSLGTWGSDCTMEQVYKQAEENARSRLRDKRGLFSDVDILNIKVTAILGERFEV